MQIIINGKGLELTGAIEEYINKKISELDRFHNQIIRAHVTVGMETRHHLKGKVFLAECRLEVPGNDVFVSNNDATLYQAIDKVRDFAEQELKKQKTMQREKDKKTKTLVRQEKEYSLT